MAPKRKLVLQPSSSLSLSPVRVKPGGKAKAQANGPPPGEGKEPKAKANGPPPGEGKGPKAKANGPPPGEGKGPGKGPPGKGKGRGKGRGGKAKDKAGTHNILLDGDGKGNGGWGCDIRPDMYRVHVCRTPSRQTTLPSPSRNGYQAVAEHVADLDPSPSQDLEAPGTCNM
jgi:hypothetical protein